MSVTTSAQSIQRAAADVPGGELPPELWELVEQHRGALINQGYSILGNTADAEEVAQETFCKAFQNREKLAQVDSVGAWLRAINHANALNRLRDRKRNAKKESRRFTELPGRQATTGGFSVLEMRDAVTKAIEELPEELRRPVVLHYWEHLNYDQIAERLGASPRTVRRQVRESYLRLYKSLGGFLSADTETGSRGGPA